MNARFFAILLLALLFMPFASCSVSSVEVTPVNPVKGDVISLKIHGDPGEVVSVSLCYSGQVSVSGGVYEVVLNNLDIPRLPNRFSTSVSGVENIRVSTMYANVIPVTINKDATNGVVKLNQSNIPPSVYDIKVWGIPLPGTSVVSLSFSASISLLLGSDGTYTYSYNTANIPPGTINVNAGGVSKQINLAAPSSGGGVVIGPINPVASYTVSGETKAGNTLLFDAAGSIPTAGTITKYLWSFGDGQTATGVQVSHIYSAPGEYMVRLTVTNSLGFEHTKSMAVLISQSNQSPVVEGGEARSCFPGQLLVFRSRGFDVDGSIVGYLWSFGDGSVSTGKRVSHSWSVPGVYSVNHTVVDDLGASAYITFYVVIEEPSVGFRFSREIAVMGFVNQYYGDMGARVVASGNGSQLYLFQYEGNPHNGVALPPGQFGAVFDLVVSDPDDLDWPLYFEVAYDRALVDNVSETSLGLYYYQGGAWRRCQITGVDVGRGVVWANLTRGELTGSPLTVGVVPPLPSFIIDRLSVLSPVEEGEPVLIDFYVSNIGTASGNIVTLIYFDESPVASRMLHLLAGEEKQVSVSFTAPLRGDHVVRVGALSVTVSVTSPTVADLQCSIVSSSVLLKPGEAVTLSYTVFNGGNRTALGFTCTLEVDGLRVSSTRIDELEPAGNKTLTYQWVSNGEGNLEAWFSVDVDDVVAETDEQNNTAVVIIEIQGAFTGWSTVVVIGGVLFTALAAFLYWKRSHQNM